MIDHLTRRLAVVCCSLALVALVGCDTSTDVNGEADVVLEGRVTDDAGYGKTSASQANIDGAVVTAANVSSSGSLNQLDGEATTSASGLFTLQVNDATHEMVVVAQKADFESRAMVFTDGRSSIQTVPLTMESYAEANVLVEARGHEDADEVTMGDVALYVTSDVASDLEAGSRSVADVAASIVSDAQARADYVREEEGDSEANEVRENQEDAFLELQADLAASADADAEAEAMDAFMSALVDAYSDAGVSLKTQAKARTSGRAAMMKFGSATFEMEKHVSLLTSWATALAVESEFAAANASSGRLDALAAARTALIADIRAAASSSGVADARADYEAAVDAELAAEADVSEAVLLAAEAAMSTAKTALDVAVSAAASASAVAAAHSQFYASAEAGAETSLIGTTEKATFAASVLAILKAS